ncbi:uncharacterized protein LOC130963209 [Arachis stenosperma]|uniref:uncharacterized protein LOC130963209 n=1 Tax=Arachis stenosperma TaxID=217475 RepID=UPI0025ABBA10|nr:uncharacterized protein LOC130963209 [Arachis stenosperma]
MACDKLRVVGNNGDAINKFKQYLYKCFHMKDLGRLKYFLGVEVAQSSKGICASGNMPWTSSLKQVCWLLSPQLLRVRKITGWHPLLALFSLILACIATSLEDSYICASPDLISPIVFIFCPSLCRTHVLNIGTPLYRVVHLIRYRPYLVETQKQQTVSASSAEAEYRSKAKTTRELIWIKDILSSLHVSHPAPIRLHCDSQVSLHIAKNPVFHEQLRKRHRIYGNNAREEDYELGAPDSDERTCPPSSRTDAAGKAPDLG